MIAPAARPPIIPSPIPAPSCALAVVPLPHIAVTATAIPKLALRIVFITTLLRILYLNILRPRFTANERRPSPILFGKEAIRPVAAERGSAILPLTPLMIFVSNQDFGARSVAAIGNVEPICVEITRRSECRIDAGAVASRRSHWTSPT